MSESKSLESVFHLVHMLKRHMHEHIEQLDLSITPMHMRVLKIIKKKQICTAVDIAHFLNRDKAQVTRLLNELIKQSLIEKVPNPEDKRSQCLLVTSEGAEILANLAIIDGQMNERMMKGISNEELKEFERITGLMAENLA
ncbi:MarR family winged helix-turn-helix transcriptional regulator [Photobacterium sp. DNB23_23_1]|uniref:MarR family transcriptional regulator n=1 Tax=Photobacterium pectinilyticum TaxID=2906793 RepID=A0ABT1N2N7_9GAMM|nr:MarR family transcriptional regulator [Photobacterium sp. ZSDE20]MCQ1058969.1 MarR family transcriptional regulator [Photobacterium sp. ZSDE20]MDD1824016.1 MarR family transcriptional regulator [Photobacterium sp. ZSDE20]